MSTLSVSSFGVILAACISLASGAAAQVNTDTVAGLSGRWAYDADVKKLGLAKACAERGVRYDVAGRELKGSGISEKDGKFVQGEFSYTILYTDDNAIAMYMTDEPRRTSSGDRMIWVAVLKNKDRFQWRAHGKKKAGKFLPWAQVRCPNA